MVGDSVSRKGGGVFEAVRLLAASLTEAPGLEVHVLGSDDEYTQLDRQAWTGVRLCTHPVVGPRAFGYAPRLAVELERIQPNVVHVHGIWMYPSVACHRWCRRRKVPYIVSPHGMLDPWALRNSGWKKRLAALAFEGRHLRHADVLHALNAAEAAAFRAYGLRNPIAVIPNAVEVPVQESHEPPEWVQRVPDDCNVLLYLGRLHPKKRVLELIRAWELSTPPDCWRLVIAGWGAADYVDSVRKAIASLGVGGRIVLASPQYGSQKSATFRRATAFVLPSASEGLPMTVLEAWAHEVPTVLTEECHLPEGFQRGAALQLPADSGDFPSGLHRLFETSSEDLHAMGRRGRELVIDRYSVRVVARAMRRVYEWAVGREEVPPELLFG